MNQWAIKIFSVVVALGLALPVRGAESLYRIGPGDEIDIYFPLSGNWGDMGRLSGQGLTLQIIRSTLYSHYAVTVSPDGTISIPSLGMVAVANRTLDDVQNVLRRSVEGQLSQSLFVSLTRSNSHFFYVSGEVKQPGPHPWERPVTLLDAIGIAGGATSDANLKKVSLWRGGEKPIRFDLSEDHLEAEGLPVIQLNPGDTVLVSRKRFLGNYGVYLFLTAIATFATVYAVTK